ncbi:MAG: MBL fold metallo-hydrolase, partial [Faecalimonas sp.]|nr:MBL fold metallo-hydrolase [Faecalimonas sp.]
VQLIYNYGIVPKLGKNFTVENIEASNGVLYQMNCANVAGSSLAMTAETGCYTVVGELLAVAVNQTDSSKVYVSENGILQVEEAGVYDVVFQKNAAYLNLGTKILVNEDCVIDLSQEEAAKQNSKIFVGWSSAEQVNGNTQASFTAGTELAAQYVSYDPMSDFAPMGMQVLKVSNVQTDKESLRFCTQASDSLLAQLQDASYAGIVYQDVTSLGAEELTVESAGATVVNDVQVVEEVNAGKLYGTEISNLDMKNSRDTYEVKAYLRYTDRNGFERVHYADCIRGSVSEVAEQVLNTVSDASAEEKAYFTELCEYVGTPIKVVFPSQAPYTKKTESGDCTYIEFPNGENMLIDASTTDGGAAIVKELQKLQVEHIDYFVATHMHRDHVQGFAKIVEQISVGKVITTGYNQNSADAYKAFLTLVQENGYETITVRQGDTHTIGGATFDFLWPEADAADVSSDASHSQQETDSNLKSMVFRMSYGEFSALFTADVFTQTEDALIEKYGEALESTVLKIAHHGEDGSTCKSLLSAVQPKLAVTMGRSNVWAVQQRCEDQGVPVYGPYSDGTITIESDGTKSWVTCEKGTKELGASATQTSVAGQMELTMFEQSPYSKDVGNGDCTYIEFANGKNMLIGATSTAGASAVLEDLQAKNVTSIDYFVATDLHQNHTGGFSTIAAQIPIGRVLMAATGKTSTDANQDFLTYVEEQAIPVQYVGRNDALILGEAELEVLWAQEDQLVVRLSYQDFSILFAGDIAKETEDALIQAYGQTLESTIYKLPYLPTELVTSDTLLSYVNPKVAVKMCKAFDAPWDLQKRFSNRQVPVYGPRYDGNVVIQTDGSQVEISCDKGIRAFAS